MIDYELRRRGDGDGGGGADGVDDPTVVATFRLPGLVGAERVAVVGEFNGWSETAHPMERVGDDFVARIPLEPGRYRFRYLLDGERWENDWAADEYVANEFGGHDSVIHVAGGDGESSRGGGVDGESSRGGGPGG